MHTVLESFHKKLSISEMAQIHDISRQTLIYYDKIDLFKPEIIDEKTGYRYYSTNQIPFLREICFLRSIGMPLADIRRYNSFDSSTSAIDLLDQQREKLTEEITRLQLQVRKIEKRVRIFHNADSYRDGDYQPAIQYFPARKVLYCEWEEGDHTRHGFHYALTRIWNHAEKHNILPSKHYGSLIFREALEQGTPLKHAGSCCLFHHTIPDLPGLHILRAGDYACMPKYSMPYDTRELDKLVSWIKANDYEIDGDIYDECLLDSLFYDKESEVDFCNLQIPIRKKA